MRFYKNNWKYFAHDFKYFATILSVCVHIIFTIDTKQEQSKKDHIFIKVFKSCLYVATKYSIF